MSERRQDSEPEENLTRGWAALLLIVTHALTDIFKVDQDAAMIVHFIIFVPYLYLSLKTYYAAYDAGWLSRMAILVNTFGFGMWGFPGMGLVFVACTFLAVGIVYFDDEDDDDEGTGVLASVKWVYT